MQENKNTCSWFRRNGEDEYFSECGKSFLFPGSNPKEAGIRECPSCKLKIRRMVLIDGDFLGVGELYKNAEN